MTTPDPRPQRREHYGRAIEALRRRSAPPDIQAKVIARWPLGARGSWPSAAGETGDLASLDRLTQQYLADPGVQAVARWTIEDLRLAFAALEQALKHKLDKQRGKLMRNARDLRLVTLAEADRLRQDPRAFDVWPPSLGQRWRALGSPEHRMPPADAATNGALETRLSDAGRQLWRHGRTGGSDAARPGPPSVGVVERTQSLVDNLRGATSELRDVVDGSPLAKLVLIEVPELELKEERDGKRVDLAAELMTDAREARPKPKVFASMRTALSLLAPVGLVVTYFVRNTVAAPSGAAVAGLPQPGSSLTWVVGGAAVLLGVALARAELLSQRLALLDDMRTKLVQRLVQEVEREADHLAARLESRRVDQADALTRRLDAAQAEAIQRWQDAQDVMNARRYLWP